VPDLALVCIGWVLVGLEGMGLRVEGCIGELRIESLDKFEVVLLEVDAGLWEFQDLMM
jgi:hypothetical protein